MASSYPPSPAPPRRRVHRHKRRRLGRLIRRLLCLLAFVILASALGLVLNALHPHADIGRDEPSPTAAPAEDAVQAAAADNKIVVAVDPGHGGVNPNIGAEDLGSEYNGLNEFSITMQTAQLLYDKLQNDGRFAPLLTADGSAYLKPSERGAAAKAAGAQLLLSIHLNYDASSASGFECYAAPPKLTTNADSLRFGRLLASAFSGMGLRLRGADGVRYLYFDENNDRIVSESTDAEPRTDPTFTVLEDCGCPAVLCEEGFITSSGDMALLSGDSGCEAAAEAYYQCIVEYFFGPAV